MKVQVGGICKGDEVHALWFDTKLKRVTRGGYPFPVILDGGMETAAEAKLKVKYHYQHTDWEYLDTCKIND